jgi:glucose-6-phosphate isomerase
MSVTQSGAWKALQNHYDKEGKNLRMSSLFANNPSRFEQMSLSFSYNKDTILLDYSKNIATDETMKLLLQLARDSQVENWRDRMFRGEPINTTEQRAVLHIALRNQSHKPIILNGENIDTAVVNVLENMGVISQRIASGDWTGYTGKRITDIVNIGIGGSDLGPVMVTEALKPYAQPGISVHFVSNIDGTHLAETLKNLSPETTLFIVASKTFTTIETITNATSAKEWLLQSAQDVHLLM